MPFTPALPYCKLKGGVVVVVNLELVHHVDVLEFVRAVHACLDLL